MRKVIFGSACMILGLLVIIVMLVVGVVGEAFASLTLLGKFMVWGGVAVSVTGVVLCLSNLTNYDFSDIDGDYDGDCDNDFEGEYGKHS